LGGQALFFLAGNVFTLLVGLPFQIYLARVLGVELLGVFSLLEGGVALVTGLVGFGIAATLPKFVPHHLERHEYTSIRSLIQRGLVRLLLAGTLVYVSSIALLPAIERQWPELARFRVIVLVMGLMVPLGLLIFFLQQGLRGFHEIRYMVIGSSFLQLATKVAITIVVFSAGWRLGGYVVAVVASTTISIVWLAVGLRRRLQTLPDDAGSEAHVRTFDVQWRKYAGVQYTTSLVGLGAGYVDRFLLGAFASASSVGVLAVIKQLQQLPGVFLQVFISVAAPMFSAVHAREDKAGRQQLYGLATDWVVKAAAPLLIFMLIYSRELLGLYGNEFAVSGTMPLCVLVGAQAINVAVGPVGTILNMSGQENSLLRLGILQTVLTIGLMVCLAPLMGLRGIAIALAISVVFGNLGGLYVARRNIGLRWFDSRFRKWVVPVVLTFLLGIFGRSSVAAWGLPALTGVLVLSYLVFYLAVLAQGLHEDDKELLRQVVTVLRRADPRVAGASDE
jgi:O-antigen/teichoic acid export membrane protein